LLGYDYKIEYKKGKENRVADALSRVKYFIQDLTSSAAVPVWATEIIGSYTSDDKCKQIIAALAVDPQSHPHYTFNKGLLRYKGKLFIGSNTQLRQSLLTSFMLLNLVATLGKEELIKD
jgi:hypothetical protein